MCDRLEEIDWQVVYVNDGSRNSSLENILNQNAEGPRFRFAEEDCQACSLQERCLSGSEAQPSRSVILHRHHRAIQRLRDYMKTESFKEEM